MIAVARPGVDCAAINVPRDFGGPRPGCESDRPRFCRAGARCGSRGGGRRGGLCRVFDDATHRPPPFTAGACRERARVPEQTVAKARDGIAQAGHRGVTPRLAAFVAGAAEVRVLRVAAVTEGTLALADVDVGGSRCACGCQGCCQGYLRAGCRGRRQARRNWRHTSGVDALRCQRGVRTVDLHAPAVGERLKPELKTW